MHSDSDIIANYFQVDRDNSSESAMLYGIWGKVAHRPSYEEALLEWITANNLPFRIVETIGFKRLLCFLCPMIRGRIPSAKTLRQRLDDVYKRNQGIVTEHLKTARSKIHISFDGWTSRNHLSFLGIHASFIDKEWNHRKLLLGMPRVSERHTGTNLAKHVTNILRGWDINEKDIGYFVLDNAYNNDTAMDELGEEFGFDPEQRRIRCIGHILNLCVKQLMFGKAAEAMDEDDSDDSIDGITEQSIKEWRKRGPVGKLHNFVHYVANSTLLCEHLRKLQQSDISSGHVPEIDLDTGKRREVVLFILDNETRWNSRFRMMKRALYLRPYFERLRTQIRSNWEAAKNGTAKPNVLDDTIADEDWDIIQALVTILGPFNEITERLQGSGSPGEEKVTYGAFWEYYSSFEFLLSHLEMMKTDNEIVQGMDDKTISILRTHMNLAWVKLDSYYSKLWIPAYCAAVVLHPCYGWPVLRKYFSTFGSDREAEWTESYRQSIRELWETEYKNLDILIDNARSLRSLGSSRARNEKEPTKFENFLLRAMDVDETTPAEVDVFLDEYDRYAASSVKADKDAYQHNPYEWWKLHEKDYPRLSKMASDVLSIPAMSAEPERGFSSAGRMVSSLRSKLDSLTIHKAQCIRSWVQEGILTGPEMMV